MNLENVTNLVPDGLDFRWYMKIKCGNCNEIRDRWEYVCLAETVEIPGSRGTANMVSKCKLCSRHGSIEIILDSIKPYSMDKNNQFQRVVVFECRGLEPVEFDPRVGWKVESVETGAGFDEVDLNEKEWCDYDENAQEENASLGIYEVESRFVLAK